MNLWRPWQDLFSLDWSLVQFKEEYFASRAAIVVVAALLLKFLWRWQVKKEASYLEHSGYLIEARNKPGLGYKILSLVSAFFLGGGIFFVFLAMADPFTIQSSYTKIEQSREIAYLRDTSISMGWRYKNSSQPRAEIVQDFVLKLIASRQDKKDRSFYAIFAFSPYLIADFTTDQQSLLFSVAVGPLVTADPSTPQAWPGKFIIKDFDKIPFEGGTRLAEGLQAVIKIFDEKGDKKRGATRSVVIITDGASETNPELQLKELQKKNIVPYLIFIDPDREAEVKIHGENSPSLKNADKLLKQVKRYGGESFLATDQAALEKIRQKFDQLYGLNAEVKASTSENHIYRLPLTWAIFLLTLGLTARLIFWKFHRVV